MRKAPDWRQRIALRRSRIRTLPIAVSVILAVLLLACTAAPSRETVERSGGRRDARGSADPSRLVIIIDEAILGFGPAFFPSRRGSAAQAEELYHSFLTTLDERGNVVPRLAERIPSLDDGTWKVNADGTMETVYRLRKNAYWHDGEPFTADDVVFGYRLARDLLSDRRGDVLALVSGVESLDASTVLVRWRAPYGFAGGLREELAPYPRRLLDEGTLGGALLARPYWTSAYIGLGPFSVNRVSSLQVDLRAFRDYFLGPPRLDGVTLRYAAGPAMVADALLGREADVAFAPSLRPSDGIALRSGWEAEKKGSVFVFPRASLVAVFQLNELGLVPSILADRAIRRGLTAALNRQQTAFAESLGLLQAPTSWWSQTSGPIAGSQPTDDDLAYNPRRAFDLFARAGWNRSPDGNLVSGGDRQLAVGLSSASGFAAADVIVRYWREIGAEVVRAGSLGSPGPVGGVSLRAVDLGAEGLLTLGSFVATGGRAGSGDPLGTGWPDVGAESLVHRLERTLRVEERLQIERELVGIVDREAPALPVAFLPTLLPLAEGVSGPLPRSGYRVRPWIAFNAHEWTVS